MKSPVECDRLVGRLDRVADAVGRSLVPAGQAKRREVGHDVQVRVAGRVVHVRRREDDAVHVPREGDVRHREAGPGRHLEEVARRQALATGDAPRVGEHALDRVDVVALEQLSGRLDARFRFRERHSLPFWTDGRAILPPARWLESHGGSEPASRSAGQAIGSSAGENRPRSSRPRRSSCAQSFFALSTIRSSSRSGPNRRPAGTTRWSFASSARVSATPTCTSPRATSARPSRWCSATRSRARSKGSATSSSTRRGAAANAASAAGPRR